MITRLLNRLGFYKIGQMKVGGHCGVCGCFDSKTITIPSEDDGWTLCEKCL